LSAQLDAESIQILAAAAKLVPKLVAQVKVRAVGYVQPSALHSSDISLSTKRARVVADALRDEGIEGAYSVSG
jgi:outer membrane protein OmpA-like peptidoglycan-associated protein